MRKSIFFALGSILLALSCAPSEGGGGTPPGSGSSGGGVTWSPNPSADRTTIVADGSDQCTITVTLKSSSGTNVTDGTIINFSTSSGTLTNPSTLQSGTSVTAVTSGGQVVVRLRSISSSTDVNATVTIDVPGSGLVSTTLTIKFSGVSVSGGGYSFTVTATPGSPPGSLPVRGTSTITATLYNTSTGAPAPNGTLVTFSATTGILTATSGATSNGVVSTTFTAGAVAGTVTISVSTSSLGGASGSLTINVSPASAGSIIFISATPTQIGVQGTLQQEISDIVFEVRDPYNNLVADNTRVDFNLPIVLGGGEFISPSTAYTTNGRATVQLHSGSKSGVVYIMATTAGGTITSASTLVTILGGTPSGAHFSLAVETGKCNIRGRIESGLTAQLSARVGDRFENPVKPGTPVWFANFCGNIGESGPVASAITNNQGEATAMFTTKGSTPAVELTNGWCMITAYVIGEEGFLDSNGNGRYDAGEPFTNATNIKGELVNFDLPDPFVDVYGSLMTASAYYTPGDTFWDINGLSYQTANGIWDARTYVWDWNLIILSGGGFVTISPTTYNLTCSNPSQGFFIMVDDYWANPLEPTTSIKASTNATAAKLSTTIDITKLGCAWPGWGGTWFTTTLSATGNKFEANKDVTVEVNSPNIYSSPIKVSATGNINPPVAALSSLVANPLNVVADGKSTSDIIASVVDSCGTPVEGANVTFTKNESGSIPGSAVFDKGSGTTGANGTITVKLTDFEQEQVTVQARVEGTLIPSSAIVSFSSPTVSIFSRPVSPTVTSSKGTAGAYITVTVRSATGAPLAGVTVNLILVDGGADPNSAALGANTGTTDGSGRFSTTLTDSEAETVTVQAQALGIQNQTNVTFADPNAGTSTLGANPTTTTLAGNSLITVTVKNAGGNPVFGASVNIVSTGDGQLSPASGTTNTNGIFTSTLTIGTLVTQTVTVSGSADTIGITQTATVTFQ